jgi:molybdate transport system substrate-binding protein
MHAVRRGAAVLMVAVVALLGGCAATAADGPAGSVRSAETASPLSGTLTIAAAASLRGAFDEIAAAFAQQHPAVDVQPITYDGSSTLATQIIGGARVDVFASADDGTMREVVDEGLAAGPRPFASNTLVIAVPAANPAGVSSIDDLADPEKTVVLCAPQVPCGAAAQTLLRRAGVEVTPASSEQNVTAVLTKVAAGEADAGLVYATDVLGQDAVAAIVPAGAADVVNTYPIVALADAPNPAAAAAFVAFVRGDEGQEILAARGFGAP